MYISRKIDITRSFKIVKSPALDSVLQTNAEILLVANSARNGNFEVPVWPTS